MIRVKQLVIGEVQVISIKGNIIGVSLGKGAKNMQRGDKVRRYTSSPGSVEARSVGFRKNELTWNFQPEPETKGFIVYRSQSGKSGSYNEIGKAKKRSAIKFVDQHSSAQPMTDSATYYYKVSAVNSLGLESSKSDMAKVASAAPPSPPGGLEVESGLIRSVNIKWNIHDNDEVAGYKLYRSESKKGDFELVNDAKKRKNVEYTDLNRGSSSEPKLEDSTSYYYAISAYSPFGDEGPQSKPVVAATADPPAPVTGFSGRGWQAGKVPLSWEIHPNEDVRGYIIYRSEENGGPYDKIAELKARKKIAYIDVGGGGGGIFGNDRKKLENSKVYHYRIEAYNWVKAKSPMSENISVMTKAVPTAPENVVAASGRPRQVPIHWQKSPDVSIKAYQIFKLEIETGEFKKIAEISSDKNYFLDHKLGDGAQYSYKVRAIDQDKLLGEFSNTIGATTKKAPDPATGLEWKEEDSKIVLHWKEPANADIEEYVIFKKSFLGWQKAGATREKFFILNKMESGDSSDYAISAIDIDKLESPRTEPIKVVIP